MSNTIISAIIALALSIGGWFGLQIANDNQILGAFGDVFLSLQVGSGPSNGEVLQTDGTDSTWVSTASLGISSDPEFDYGTNVFSEVSFATSTNAEINGTGT